MPYRLSNGFGQTTTTDRMTDATVRAQKERDTLALKLAQAGATPAIASPAVAKIMAQIDKLREKHMRRREAWRRESDAYRKKVGRLLTKIATVKAVPARVAAVKKRVMRKVRAVPVAKKRVVRMKAGRIFRR